MIKLTVPGLPPTTNHAYVRVRGKTFLGPVGKKYKKETINFLSRNFPQELRYFQKNKPYFIGVLLQFSDESKLLNKGYPKATDNRYKKLDVTNRIKLFEDCLSEVTAVDDSQHWSVLLTKRLGPEDLTIVHAINMEDGVHELAEIESLYVGEV